MLKSMFKKTYTLIDSKYKDLEKSEEPGIPAGLWLPAHLCGGCEKQSFHLSQMQGVFSPPCLPEN